MDVGVIMLFYGLYYGVMGRDFAELCSDYMASTIGVGAVHIQPKLINKDNVAVLVSDKSEAFNC